MTPSSAIIVFNHEFRHVSPLRDVFMPVRLLMSNLQNRNMGDLRLIFLGNVASGNSAVNIPVLLSNRNNKTALSAMPEKLLLFTLLQKSAFTLLRERYVVNGG
jgi:hypothetical protein